jgi:hypothetical protein
MEDPMKRHFRITAGNAVTEMLHSAARALEARNPKSRLALALYWCSDKLAIATQRNIQF